MIAQYKNLFQSSNTEFVQGPLQNVNLHTPYFVGIFVKKGSKFLCTTVNNTNYLYYT